MSELQAGFLYECTLPTASSTWSVLIEVLDRRMFHVKQIPLARCRARYRSRPLLQTKSSCFRRTATAEHRTAHRLDESCLLFEHLTRTFLFPPPPMFHVKHCFSAPLAINVSRETFVVKWANSGKRSVPHSRMFHVKHKGRTRVDRNTGRRLNLVIRTYPNFLPSHSTHEILKFQSSKGSFKRKPFFNPYPTPYPNQRDFFAFHVKLKR